MSHENKLLLLLLLLLIFIAVFFFITFTLFHNGTVQLGTVINVSIVDSFKI